MEIPKYIIDFANKNEVTGLLYDIGLLPEQIVTTERLRELMAFKLGYEALTADRDKWKAMALELGAIIEDNRDYLTEYHNSILDDERPRYERERKIVRADLEKNEEALAKLKEMETK